MTVNIIVLLGLLLGVVSMFVRGRHGDVIGAFGVIFILTAIRPTDPCMLGEPQFERVDGDFYPTPPENLDCLAHFLDLRSWSCGSRLRRGSPVEALAASSRRA
jgi:hypothetical protein